MPELPEVETIRRQLCEAGVEGRTIDKISIGWFRTVEPLSPAVFRKQVTGRTIQKLSRHGKWLIFELDHKDNLLVHLRMTGGFYLSEGRLKKGPHDRAILQLSGGLNLHFRDPRKFGRFRIVGQASLYPESLCSQRNGTRSRKREARPTIEGLGPDVLTLQKSEFFQGLERRKKVIKALLLDQSFVAGVGNIYADEALFEARLHPERRPNSLAPEERAALYKAVRRVIRAGVRNGGTSLGDGQGNYTDLNGQSGGHREKVKVYGRTGKPCVVCGTLLEKITIAQRTTVFCPRCQK